jgi:hypothetical protein
MESGTKYNQSIFQAQIDKDTVESTREITFVIASEATGREHRNKFIYNWDNWELSKFNSNPIVGYQHNVYGDNMCSSPNPDDVIAKATAWLDTFQGKKVLMSKATFEPPELNATADKVFRKIIFGSLNSSSTGVKPMGDIKKEFIKNSKGENIDYTLNFPGQELLEWSVVNIPADAAALKRSYKSHTLSALSYVQKFMPELSLNDLKGMKVQDILDLFEKRTAAAETEIMEEVLSGPDPNLNKYKEQLSKYKK